MGDTSIDEGGGGEGSGRADDEGGDGELHGSDIQREEFVKIMIMCGSGTSKWGASGGAECKEQKLLIACLVHPSFGRFAISSK